MIYNNTLNGIFLERPNRFIAKVLVNGVCDTVHVKNTGRCKELLIRGVTVILQLADNPNRKTKYSLIAVYKGDRLINMDSQVPNSVVQEALETGKIKEINASNIKREVTYGNSRFDLSFNEGSIKSLLEVKGVTLERSNIAYFPDAPTTRGRKHILELIEAKKAGYNAYICMLIQMSGVNVFKPNYITDPDFGEALKNASNNGVKVLAYNSIVKENEICIGEKISVELL